MINFNKLHLISSCHYCSSSKWRWSYGFHFLLRHASPIL